MSRGRRSKPEEGFDESETPAASASAGAPSPDLDQSESQPAETNAANSPAKSNWAWRLGLIFAGGVVFSSAVIGGVFAGLWLYSNLVVHIEIRDQEVSATLPEEFTAIAEVTNELVVDMKGEIEATVPFNQPLTVPFNGRYDFDVELQANVPVKFEVEYDGILPIDTVADVTIVTSINYKNLKALRNLKIDTQLPLNFPLPVKLNIPVEDVIDLRYTGPLSADINQNLRTTVNTVLKTKLPIDQTVRTPVTAALPLTVFPDKEQVRLLLSTLDIALQPEQMLDYDLPSEREGPARSDSIWGDQDTGGVPTRATQQAEKNR